MFRRNLLAITAILAFAGCTQTGTQQTSAINSALTTVPGQLFCSFQLAGGGAIAAGLIDTLATGKTGAAAPVAVLATNQTAQTVSNLCTAAMAGVPTATSAVPVPPPAAPVASVLVTVPVK